MDKPENLINLYEKYKQLNKECMNSDFSLDLFNRQHEALEAVASFVANNSNGRLSAHEVGNMMIIAPDRFESIVYMRG